MNETLFYCYLINKYQLIFCIYKYYNYLEMNKSKNEWYLN